MGGRRTKQESRRRHTMYSWNYFATRCHLFLLTLAIMARYIRLKYSFWHHHVSGKDSMLAAPIWYRWRWSLPPGPMDVCGGRTISETVPRYREWTQDHAMEVALSGPHSSRYHAPGGGMTWWTWHKKDSSTRIPPGDIVMPSSSTPTFSMNAP